MYAEVRLRSGSGYNTVTILRTVNGLSFDSKYADIGAISFTMPRADAVALGVDVNSVIEVLPIGASGPATTSNLWYGIDGSQGSNVVDGAVMVQFSGKSLINWLTDCVVYPSTWHPSITPADYNTYTYGSTQVIVPKNATDATKTTVQGHAFENATPGNIIRTLVARGVERGGLSWLDVSTFTGLVDTSGAAWNSTLTTTYANGTTLLQVIQDLSARDIIDYRMDGAVLKMYNYGTTAVFYTPTQITLRAGQSISDQTRTKDASIASSAVLIVGDAAALEELSDSTIQTTLTRRREKFVAQGGVTDITKSSSILGTLGVLGKAQLAITGHVQTEDTIAVYDNGPTPWFNFQVGDWLWVDYDGTLKNLQVQQIAASVQENRTLLLGLTLGDVIKRADERNQLLIDNMVGQNAGSYGALPNQNDKKPPSDPTTVVASPVAYRDANGIDWCQMTITWTSPTTNIDGTTLNDLDHFELQYKVGGSTTWSNATNIPGNSAPLAGYISSLPTGKSFACQVRAVDTLGNASNWVAQSNTISSTPKITTAPGTLSTPVVTPSFKATTIAWDGKDSSGNPMPASFAYMQVHLSTVSSFVPTLATQVGTLSDAGTVTVTGLTPAVNYYSKFVAVDKSQNLSSSSIVSAAAAPTALAVSEVAFTARDLGGITTFTQSTTPVGAVAKDLWVDTGNGNVVKTYTGSVWTTLQVGTNAISASAVTASQIAANTITAGQIATGTITANELAANSVTAAKILAGSITASKLSVTVGGGNLLINSNGGILTSLGVNSGATLATDLTKAFYNSIAGSVKVTVSAFSGSGAARLALSLLPNTTYTFSAYINIPTSGGPTLGVNLVANGAGLVSTVASAAVTGTNSWIRQAITFTTNSTATPVNLFVANAGTSTAGQTFNTDAWQLELGDVYTAYAPKVDEVLPGTIVANMISAGAITANMINTGTLGADIVLGASIKTASSGARVELSSLGVTGYNSTEDQTITISSQDGSVTIAGALTGNISQSTMGESNIVNSNIRGTDVLLDDTGGQVFAYIPTNQTTTTFSTAGTPTWTCPAGVFSVKVECWGGGGGGGGGAALGTFGGFGGAGGEYAREDFVPVTPGTVYNLVVGAAGVGGAAVNDSGITSGGTSQFVGDGGFLVIAHGGGRAIGAYTIGGGTGSSNEIHFNGGGTNPNAQHATSTGQGGASSAGTSSAGKSNRSNAAGNGLGGLAVTGGGSGGNGGNTAQVGQPGGFPGGAGGGGGGASGGFAGGAGARGQVKVTYGGLTVTFTASTDTVTFLTAHNYTVNAPISFTGTSGGSPIVDNTTYYVNTVPSSTTLTLSTLPPAQGGTLLDITTNGTARASTVPTLVASLSGVSGVDAYGNAFPAGLRINPFGGGGWDTSWQVVGASGKPAFTNSWGNTANANDTKASYYKDAMGFVHFQGIVIGAANPGTLNLPIFTLPVGYRPSATHHFVCASTGTNYYHVTVGNTGTVTAISSTASASYMGLTSLSFLAES